MSKFDSLRDEYRHQYDGAIGTAKSLFPVMVLGFLLVAFLLAAIVNMPPYLDLTVYLLGQFSIPAFPDFLSSLPIIGGFLSQIRGILYILLTLLAFWIAYKEGGWWAVGIMCGFVVFTVCGGIQFSLGVFLWALVNGCQVAWLFFAFDESSKKGVLRESERIDRELSGKKFNHRRDRGMIERLKATPYAFVSYMSLAAFISYCIDFGLNAVQYPPAESFQAFVDAVQYCRWSLIDGRLFVTMIFSVLSIEWIAVGIKSAYQWLRMSRVGRGA